MGRGVLSGSGAVRSLGRSLAFASGGFLAFAGVSKFLTDSVNAARDMAVSQRSLAAQMKASGESFKSFEPTIEKVSLAYGKFGFENDEVVKSLTILDRATGNIGEAMRRQTLVAEIARVKNIDLAQAAAVVGKVYGGQETALRRAIPGLSKNAKGVDLLNEAQRRLRGQLAANTTASERFHAQLHDTQEIIGGGLLPVLNRYLNALGGWLGRMNETGQLQRDVSRTMKTLTRIFGTLWSVVRDTASALGDVASALGGWGNAMKLAIGAWVGFKVAGIGAAATVATANIVAAGVTESAWKAALLSTGWGAFAVAAGAAAAYTITHWEKVKLWFRLFWIDLRIGAITTARQIAEPFSHIPDIPGTKVNKLGRWARDLKDETAGPLADLQAQATATKGALDALGPHPAPAGALGPAKATPRDPLARFKKFKFPTTPAATTSLADKLAKESAKAIERLQLGIDRSSLTAGLADDLAALEKLRAYLVKRIKIEKTNLDLRKQLVATEKQIADTSKQMADARAARQKARQFGRLGLGPTGEPLIPGVALLRRRLLGVREAIRGTFLDTDKTKGLLANIQEVLSGRLGKVSADVRAKVAEMLANIREQLRQHSAKVAHTPFVKANVDAILAGLGLSPRQQRSLRIRFAAVGPGGTVATPSGQFAHAGTVTINGGVHLHGVQDVKGMEAALMKRSRQRAHSRRGR